MKITKDYPGLTRAKNGYYILKGNLISDDGIEIDLDDQLIVTGSIIAGCSIRVRCGITAERGIKAGWGIRAGWGIKAGCGITAGWGIEARTYIDCGKRIFAGTSMYADDDDCDKTIQCAELRNRTVAYGDLIITTISKATED